MAGIGVQDHRNLCSGSRNPRSRSRNRCSRWIGISVQDGPEYAVLCGMQPAVAVALTEMGRELIGVNSALNLEQGVDKIYALIKGDEAKRKENDNQKADE